MERALVVADAVVVARAVALLRSPACFAGARLSAVAPDLPGQWALRGRDARGGACVLFRRRDLRRDGSILYSYLLCLFIVTSDLHFSRSTL